MEQRTDLLGTLKSYQLDAKKNTVESNEKPHTQHTGRKNAKHDYLGFSTAVSKYLSLAASQYNFEV